ncbi:MAG: putative selenium-dependent hydroxylase accessory protein YqeC, partial [Firmicutes bacterium]|nr:putative selenium-dependent hydroxylase accessory protein YqeC [Bacillota bacterium]
MMICITGAGGKTSLLYALGEQAFVQGKPVAVSTTTHIRQPERDYPFPVLGTPCEDGKLSALPAEELADWNRR